MNGRVGCDGSFREPPALERRYGFAEEEPPGVADPKKLSSRLSRVWHVTAKGYRQINRWPYLIRISGFAMAQAKTGGTAERFELNTFSSCFGEKVFFVLGSFGISFF